MYHTCINLFGFQFTFRYVLRAQLHAAPFPGTIQTANPTPALAVTKTPLHTNLCANTNGLSKSALSLSLIQQTVPTGQL
jgi:hypothetical protein